MSKDGTSKGAHRETLQEGTDESKEFGGSGGSWQLDLNELLTLMGHDLQEPLRKIRAFSQTLLSDEKDRLSEQGLDRLERLGRSVRRLEDYVSALLAYLRSHQSPLELKNVELTKMVQEVLGFLADCDIYNSTIHEVIVQPLPALVADEMQMRILFQNLIGNALKFSSVELQGHQPRVWVRSKADSEKCLVEIEVADNGVGFESHQAEKIFAPFYRVHGSKFGGTGLGLTLCKNIVLRHCGQISAYGRSGAGACFRILLPMNLDLKLGKEMG